MMREILFRGKRLDNDEWVYGFPIVYKNGTVVMCRECHRNENVNPTTVGQYTGLKDRAGQCIFDGDIVYIRCEEEYGVVDWDSDTARFTITHEGVLSDFDNYYGTDLEVIGNRWDNPELLEDAE